MSEAATIQAIDNDLLHRLDPDGRMNLSSCLQCGRCSAGCAMRLETDILPHQLNRMVLFGLEEELLASRAIWTCLSCQTCVSRCPMKVDTPALVDRLRGISRKAPKDVEGVRIFNETLLRSVRRFGRVYDFGLMAEYKLRARDLFSDVGKLPTMLRKRKMALLPPLTGGRKAVARIFDRVRRMRRSER